jgi:hypothetical protein
MSFSRAKLSAEEQEHQKERSRVRIHGIEAWGEKL